MELPDPVHCRGKHSLHGLRVGGARPDPVRERSESLASAWSTVSRFTRWRVNAHMHVSLIECSESK